MSKRLSQKSGRVVRERRKRLNNFVKCQIVSCMLLLDRYNVHSDIWHVWNRNRRTKDSRLIVVLIYKRVSFLALQSLQDVTDATNAFCCSLPLLLFFRNTYLSIETVQTLMKVSLILAETCRKKKNAARNPSQMLHCVMIKP